jgi:hypothetical protein
MAFEPCVNDLTALKSLAWALYQDCKEASECFYNIHLELSAFHTQLKEAERTLYVSALTRSRQKRLQRVEQTCLEILNDLGDLVGRYESLESRSENLLDPQRRNYKAIKKVRLQLRFNTIVISGFIR